MLRVQCARDILEDAVDYFPAFPSPSSLVLVPAPDPPRQPLWLIGVLQRYAAALFDCEDGTYPQPDELSSRRSALVTRIEKQVMETALKLGNGLSFHASPDEMMASVRDGLAHHINKRAQAGATDTAAARVSLVPDAPQTAAGVKHKHGPARKDLPKSYATPLGRNLDRLRRECGLSFAGMAATTGVSKRLILRHVNEGKSAHPSTLATYASGFTDRLGRLVTVAELEG